MSAQVSEGSLLGKRQKPDCHRWTRMNTDGSLGQSGVVLSSGWVQIRIGRGLRVKPSRSGE